ncbi:unnamed protein product [Larinioides sclopetarius]|uniref:C3H1-type domain-containing protein n=1 Tax=Larinioides sclopetarius TaxID=280406 RepID=A0AAV1Z145_9ARAC
MDDDNESSQSTDDTVDLEEGEILDSGAEEEEEKDFSKSSLKEALDKSLVQNIEQLANHKGNAKSEGSPDCKAASSRKQKKMAANYMDPDRIDDESDEEDGWFPGSPKYKSKYNDKPVDYRMELEAYRGTPPSSPERKRRDEKSRKKKSSKKSKKTRKTIRRKDIKGVRVAKYKKDAARGRICKFFKEGKCAKGSDCMYSHSAPPPPFKKKELCKFYLNGHCNKGKDCLYMHSEFPCKFYHTGSECYAKDDCRFSHAPLNEEMKRVLHDYLRISHGDDVRLRCDDDRDEERTGNDRERDRDRDRDRKRRRSCSPEQPRGPPPKRTCLLGSPPRHIREAEETKRWQEEMKMLQQQQPGFEIRLSPNPEEGSSAHFKPNFYQETLLNSPSPKKRPPNPETPNSFHGNTSNNYPRESPSKVYIYDDDEFIEIDLPPPPVKQEPPEEFHWDNVHSITQHEENHIKPFHENSQQDLDFTSDVKFDETTQFSEMESSTDCPPNLSPSQASLHDFKDNDEGSSQGPVKIKEEKFSDEETNASSQEAPAPPIVIPSHLPPKQRELLKRVLHNNQKKKTASDAPGSPSANEGTDSEIKKEESDVEEKVESQPKDYKWYSSEDDDDDDDTVQPLTAVLKRIQQDPPSKPIIQETKPSLKLLDMFEHIQRKGKSQESSNGQAQQQKQSQNQFWENLFGGKPPSLPLPVTNSNNPPSSEPKRRTLLPDPILPPSKMEPVAPKESVEIKDPRLKNRDPRKLANMPVPAPKIATFDQKNDTVSAASVLTQNAITVKPIPVVSADPSKESIPYKLRGISAKPPNYTPLIHASQSNPNLLKDPRLRKHLNPNANSDVIGNGKETVTAKPPVQTKGIPPIPELLLKYEPLKAINIFETSSKSAVKAEEPKPAIVYDPRRIRRDSRSNSGSDTPPHLTIVDTISEEKPAPVLENEREFVEEKKWLPPVLERNWAPPVLERNWASIVDKTEIKTEINEEPSLKLETSRKSSPKKSPSPPPSTKEEFITVIKKEPSPIATSNTHPIVPPLIIKKVKPTPPASHLPRAIADPRMARLHDRNSRPLVSSDINSKSIVERKKVTTPAEPPKTTDNVAADTSNSSEIPKSVNLVESQKESVEEVSDKASKEEKSKSAKSIPKKRRLSDKSDEKKRTVHRNRKSSMDYASPLNSYDASKDSKSLGYNSYNQRPKRTVPTHSERMSPNSGVSSTLTEVPDSSMPEFVLSDSSNLECDNSSDVNLRDRFKTIDPTASPFC